MNNNEHAKFDGTSPKNSKRYPKKQSEINSTIYSTQNEFLSVEMYGSKKFIK